MSEPKKPVGLIFDAAIELPPERRAAYLEEACAGDDSLRLRVEALLRAHESAGTFMDSPAAAAARAATVIVKPVEQPGDKIGRYKLLQQIGEGGCGVVYMAEQEEPVRRRVALKVIKLGMDTKNVIARFDAERQALALMNHPNIAKVLDAGATEAGRPYFVMELVKAVPITRYCDENKLSTVARLGLFVQVCQAIQHAHQKGIIHRDIKPSNILVADHDGVPVPKIIDFGIAKATSDQRLTDKTLFTALEQFIGTPAYMSPEQAKLSGLDIDTRSDIYSLGVLLYELLTGTTPFEAKRLLEAGLDEVRRIIREEEPLRPSTRLHTLAAEAQTTVAKLRQSDPPKLVRLIWGDLDWIVMKALDKDRTRRYETANGLARDIQRHLNDEPVVASPPGKLYKFQKLVRRNKFAFAAGAVIAALLILGFCAATVAMFRIRRDNQQIRLAKDDAMEKLWAAYLAEARGTRTSGRAGQRFDSLEAVRKAAAIHPNLALRNEAIACLSVSDLRLSKQNTLKVDSLGDGFVCYDFNLEKYAVRERDGSITVRAGKDNRELAVLPAPGLALRWVGPFSANSRYLEVRYSREHEADSARVWDIEQQKAVLTGLPSYWATEFSPDSQLFATSNPDGTLSVYELASGKEIKRLPATRQFMRLLFNPANTKLACFSAGDPSVEIRGVESGRDVFPLRCPAAIASAAWSADGKRFATGCDDHRVYVWDAENRQQLAALEGPTSRIDNVGFNHAGNLLASTGWDDLTRLWDLEARREIASHPGGGLQLQFSSDDRYVQGWREGSQYGSLEVATSAECRLLYVQHPAFAWSGPEFSADGRMLAAGTADAESFWDAFSGKKITSVPLAGCATHIFHPDGLRVIVIHPAGAVCLRSLERIGVPSSSAYRLGRLRWLSAPSETDASIRNPGALSLDGRHLAVTHESAGESLILDLQDPSAQPVVLKPDRLVDVIDISPDGRWAATASWHSFSVKVWDARSGDLLRTLQGPHRTTVKFSPDGRWLATSSTEYQLWEVGSWQPKGPPVPGHPVAQWNLTAFNPDGRVMARTTKAGNIQLTQTLTASVLATIETPGHLQGIQFSPDGSHLAAVQGDQQVRLWDLRLIRQELKEMHLDWDLPPYPPVQQVASEGPPTLEVESDSASQANLSAIPSRGADTASNLIDLSPYYNAGLTKTWHSGSLNNSLINLPSGVQTLARVAFDLRGLIQLRGESRDENRFPEQVVGIRVERKAREIHFLHATQRRLPDGSQIGHYVIHYADGSEANLPIIYGQNIRDWWGQSGETTGPGLLVQAWSGYNEQSPTAGSIRLFKWTWENPFPNQEVGNLDFVSGNTLCAPFLVAITAE